MRRAGAAHKKRPAPAPAAEQVQQQQAKTVFEIADSADHPNRGVAAKVIQAECADLVLLDRFLETYRHGADPTYDPGYQSFWQRAPSSFSSCS